MSIITTIMPAPVISTALGLAFAVYLWKGCYRDAKMLQLRGLLLGTCLILALLVAGGVWCIFHVLEAML